MVTVRMGVLLLLSSILFSCSKNSNSGPVATDPLNGVWVTSVWGGAADTAKMQITTASGNGSMIYLNAGAAAATNFAVSDIVLTKITMVSTGTYSATVTYRYNNGSGPNKTIGHTQTSLTLQSGNTVLYMHSSLDAGTGITPPDYYWYKEK